MRHCKCGAIITANRSRCPDCLRQYQREFYRRNREHILRNARARYEQAEYNGDVNFTKLDRHIRRILGHPPEWWEREYWLE